MDTFNFPYHLVKTQYPDSGDTMVFGKAYVFTSKPSAPDQRTFILTFPGMKYYFTAGVVNNTDNPTTNYKVLQEFYEAHRLWATFIYPHPVLGNINVKFGKPLADPDPIPEGNGAQSSFEIQLIEQP